MTPRRTNPPPLRRKDRFLSCLKCSQNALVTNYTRSRSLSPEALAFHPILSDPHVRRK